MIPAWAKVFVFLVDAGLKVAAFVLDRMKKKPETEEKK